MSEREDLGPLLDLVADAVARTMGVERMPAELEPVVRRALFEAHRRGRLAERQRPRRRDTKPLHRTGEG